MKNFNTRGCILGVMILCILFAGPLSSQTAELSAPDQNGDRDSSYTAILIRHLRQNFDDIHDVSMRFHHSDHKLNGRITLHLEWSSARLDTAWVNENETGNPDFARELIKNIGRWEIQEISDRFTIDLPLMIRIVGKDDPTFEQKAILTGRISDASGNPVLRAQIRFASLDTPGDTLVTCFTNREGIFVRTLIPPGNWQISVHHDSHMEYPARKITFSQGEHQRIYINLKKL